MTFIYWLKERLSQPLPGQKAQIKMKPEQGNSRFKIPKNAKDSGVLLFLSPEKDDLSLIVIARSRDGGVHSGQMAFPGGKREHFDASLEETALRESAEEIHLKPSDVNILGRLTPLYIPVSNFLIHPVIGFHDKFPDYLYPSMAEVSEILKFSFKNNFQEKETQLFQSHGFQLKAPGYRMDEDHFLWGASAMILAEVEMLWFEFLGNG